jgi:hypothetical protein
MISRSSNADSEIFRSAKVGEAPIKLEERITIGRTEMYRSYDGDGQTVKAQCASQKIMDQGGNMLVLAEDWSGKVDAPGLLLRYQLTNIVQSVSTELDDTGQVISYEEYSPYGTSTYQVLLRKVPNAFDLPERSRIQTTGCTTSECDIMLL